jgi:hypothetical protein
LRSVGTRSYGQLAVVAVVTFAALAAACSLRSGTASPPPNGDGNTGGIPPYNPNPPPMPPSQVDNDAGSLVGRRGSDAGETDAPPRSPGDSGQPESGSMPSDASGVDVTADDTGSPVDSSTGTDSGTTAGDSSVDSGPVLCPAPLGAGDLAIVELMIKSVNAFGDQGEWLEVQSTRSCILDLNGLHAESPRTTSAPFTPDTLDITTERLLPPSGIFVIANTLDATINHQLPTAPLLLAWAGSPADVLQDGGDRVTLSANGTVIEDLSYPAFVLVTGTSISFPANCAWSDLPDWQRWSYSQNFWTGTFQGTPNAANTDVTCF